MDKGTDERELWYRNSSGSPKCCITLQRWREMKHPNRSTKLGPHALCQNQLQYKRKWQTTTFAQQTNVKQKWPLLWHCQRSSRMSTMRAQNVSSTYIWKQYSQRTASERKIFFVFEFYGNRSKLWNSCTKRRSLWHTEQWDDKSRPEMWKTKKQTTMLLTC